MVLIKNEIPQITHNDVPEFLGRLYLKIENLERLFTEKGNLQPEADQLLIIQQAAEFTHLSVPTVYGKVSKKEIPYIKKGKRLFFSQKDLTDWLRSGRIKTNAEIANEADQYLASKRHCK